MKKNYIYAVVALGLAMMACEPADEISVQQNESISIQAKNMQSVNGAEVNYILLYRSLVDNFETHSTGISTIAIEFENYALSNGAFQSIVPEDYQNIELSEVFKLSEGEVSIDRMSYRNNVKEMANNIINKSVTLNQIVDNASIDASEKKMLITLYNLNNQGNGNDDRWRINRAIAFAYGSQNNIAEGLLYAGIIETINSSK